MTHTQLHCKLGHAHVTSCSSKQCKKASHNPEAELFQKVHSQNVGCFFKDYRKGGRKQ